MQGREKGKLFGILIISSKCVFTMTLWPEMKVLTPLWPESSGLMTSCTWRKKVYLIFCTWSLKRILHNISFTFNENQYFIIRNCNIIFLIFRGQSDLKNKLRTQKKIPIWWGEIAGNLIEEKKKDPVYTVPWYSTVFLVLTVYQHVLNAFYILHTYFQYIYIYIIYYILHTYLHYILIIKVYTCHCGPFFSWLGKKIFKYFNESRSGAKNSTCF